MLIPRLLELAQDAINQKLHDIARLFLAIADTEIGRAREKLK